MAKSVAAEPRGVNLLTYFIGVNLRLSAAN
jgi:hypothetical protein